MATSEEFLTFVCEQIARFGAVRYRKMFGDATVYLDDKPILLVCDNTVFVKCLPETAALLPDAGTGTPYDGAQRHTIAKSCGAQFYSFTIARNTCRFFAKSCNIIFCNLFTPPKCAEKLVK